MDRGGARRLWAPADRPDRAGPSLGAVRTHAGAHVPRRCLVQGRVPLVRQRARGDRADASGSPGRGTTGVGGPRSRRVAAARRCRPGRRRGPRGRRRDHGSAARRTPASLHRSCPGPPRRRLPVAWLRHAPRRSPRWSWPTPRRSSGSISRRSVRRQSSSGCDVPSRTPTGWATPTRWCTVTSIRTTSPWSTGGPSSSTGQTPRSRTRWSMSRSGLVGWRRTLTEVRARLADLSRRLVGRLPDRGGDAPSGDPRRSRRRLPHRHLCPDRRRARTAPPTRDGSRAADLLRSPRRRRRLDGPVLNPGHRHP